MSDTAIINGRNRAMIEEEIAYLRDDNIVMRKIINSESDPATVRECEQRFQANTDQIRSLQRDLISVVSADF